ncbi:hypothetical protein ACYZUD_31565 [Pseudomonas sp. XS1P51]
MNNLKSIIILTFLSLGLFHGNAHAMDIHEYIRIESAKIEHEYNCTINGKESSFTAKIRDPQEVARELTEALSATNPVTCVRPKYEYACFFPENKNVPLSGSVTFPYWSNEPTLEKFKSSETGKKLHNCQGAWW